jgi:hypothetical protein
VEVHSLDDSPLSGTPSTAVECRICHQTIKKSGVFCEGCSLVGHAGCVVGFPLNCDPLARAISYAQYTSQGDLTSPRLGTPVPSTPPPTQDEFGVNKLFHPWRKPRPSFDGGRGRPSFDGTPRSSMDSRPRPSIDTLPPNPTPVLQEPVPQRPRRTSLFSRNNNNHAAGGDQSSRSRASLSSSQQSSSGRSAVTANSRLSTPPRMSDLFTPRQSVEAPVPPPPPEEPPVKKGKKKERRGSSNQSRDNCVVQ